MFTSLAVCSIHLRANSPSLNLHADSRARRRISRGFSTVRAFSKAAAKSAAVVAWNPSQLSAHSLL